MQIKPETLYRLITKYYDLEEEDEKFIVIKNILLSADIEDGGGTYELILKDVATSKYYSIHYSDWDIMNTDYNEDTNTCDGRIDLAQDLTEVVPKQVISIIYEKVEN